MPELTGNTVKNNSADLALIIKCLYICRMKFMLTAANSYYYYQVPEPGV